MEVLTKFNFIYIAFTVIGSASLMLCHTSSRIGFAKNVVFIPIFLMLLLLLLRDRGWDLQNYKNIFDNIQSVSFSGWVEPGFQVAIIFVKKIGGGFNTFNFLYAISICLLTYLIATHELRYPLVFVLLLLLVYFFRGPYGQMRQALAMLLFMFSLRYIERKQIRFFIINSVALTMHSIAILPLVAFLLLKYMRFTKKQYVVGVIVFLFFILGNLSTHILNLSLFHHSFFMKLQFYLSNSHSTGGFITPVVFRIIFVTIILAFIFPRFTMLSNYEKIILNTFFIGIVTYALCSYDLRIASRASRVFIIVELLILAKAMEYSKNKVILSLIYLLYGALFLVWELYIMSKAEVIYTWS
ncbi:EpsG family protein [Aliivibrio logei]|uniref:EpsG family protein n=1 Tax=Aliivibrio logei TaxID=688 RepID=A0A1B9NVG1_ALILO|nr:EpsG family protein [Aliivibrio logei]OCH18563.1 hypothetical protein A6E04_01710 [Aliivibrio logei]